MTKPVLSHPSVLILKELKERGWSLHDFVFRMHRYKSEKEWQINCLATEMYLTVHDPDIILSDEMAADFSRALGISKDFFLNLHKQWKASAGECAHCTMEEE